MSEYLSVSEYAKIHKKDPGNIRRFLKSGRLHGQKVGNQWIIPYDALYPNDMRKSENKILDQRKKQLFLKHEKLMNTILDMVNSLKEIYGKLISEIILYGSYARGEETDESDVDIAIILFEKAPKETNDKMINCVASYELKCDKVLSVIDIDYEKFNKWKNYLPFYKNICKDGIVLWKSKK